MDRMRFEVIGELCGADSVTYLASTFSQWPAAGVAAALFPSRHRMAMAQHGMEHEREVYVWGNGTEIGELSRLAI